MKKKLLKRIICILFALVLVTETNVTSLISYASEITEEQDSSYEEEIEEEIPPTANSYLYPFEEAVEALVQLGSTKEIQAVIYLQDEVVVKTLPEDSSEPVKILVSGDVVSITGAGQDEEYNIWYQIVYKNEFEEVSGYIRKENLACVDPEFLQWQDNYVRSISVFGRMRSNVSYADVEMFPESYQEALMELKDKHPNWIFVKMNTNIDWKTLVNSQLGERSLIYTSTSKDSWKNGRYGTTAWSYASEGILKYYLDPRNWLLDKDIFQFELLGYYSEYHTVEAVEGILAGSFMANKTIDNGKTYAQTFVELGKLTGVSPFLMATRVRQEQGASGTSALISGKYKGYEGYYNYYNISASGTSDKEVIITGLEKAKKEGWDSQYKALKAGAEFLGSSYINAGQDTLYLQKFDVDNRVNGVFWHNYMQNIQAPYTEGRKVFQAYSNKNMLTQAFIFRIPVYNNMPKKAVVLPGEEDKITLSSSVINNLQVDGEITLRPYINGKETEGINWIFDSSNKEIATVDAEGIVKAKKPGVTTITCKNADDIENPNVGTCKITVVKADIDVSKLEKPQLKAVTYDPGQTLSDISLPKGYEWVNPKMKPIVAQSAYGVIYNPNEEKYNAITFNVTLKVNKKTLSDKDYVIPTGLEGGATRQLSSIMLPNGFYWNQPEETLADTIGTKNYMASYNPDTANYETVTDIPILVKIICDKHDFSQWEIVEATCDKDGVKSRKCSICSNKEELVLEKKGHIYDAVITVEATETKEGIRTYTCKNCSNSYTEKIPKLPQTHVHKYEGNIVKKASCTENGKKQYTCDCGDKYVENIKSTGHKIENGRCLNCGYTEAIREPEQGKDDNLGSQNNSNGNQSAQNGSGSNQNGQNSNSGNSNTSHKTENNNSDVKEEGSSADKKPEESKPENSKGEKPKEESKTENSKPEGSDTEESKAEESVTEISKAEEANSEETKTEVPNVEESNLEETKVEIPKSEEEKSNEVKKETSKVEESKQEEVKEESKEQIKTQEITKTEEGLNTVNLVEVELMEELIKEAGKKDDKQEVQTVSIQLKKNTEISHAIVKMAKEHGVDLEVKLPNNLKWKIQSESLGDEMPSSINMNAELTEEIIEKDVLLEVVKEKEYLELRLSHNGEFGFEAALLVPVDKKYQGQTANLFYFNEKSGELEFQMATRVDKDNNIELVFHHASDYVIVFATESMEQVISQVEDVSSVDSKDTSIEKNLHEKQEKEDSLNRLLAVCVIICIISGILAVVGYLFCKKGNKEQEEMASSTFEEWLREEPQIEMSKANNVSSDDYLDDDVDDYREKEKPAENISSVSRDTKKEELDPDDYLDDDVDDYREKE